MEELAKRLHTSIGLICLNMYYNKKFEAVKKGIELRDDIELFTGGLLQMLEGDVSEDAAELKSYTIQVLNDYVEAAANEDEILMADTLDNGLSELLKLFIEE